MTFKPSGSRYYVLTAAWTYDPPGLAEDLNHLRFSEPEADALQDGAVRYY